MEDLITTFHPKHFIEESSGAEYSFYQKCIICEKMISFGTIHFYCRVCDFRFHKECPTILMESTNLTINRPETHEHTLTFVRKKNSFNCDACGLVYKDEMNMYACLPCNFFVHRKCIYLPKVIKLTRHLHRLFHTFQVLDWKTNCRICNRQFVSGCGGYICINKTCDYKLHSYCATEKEVWDGKDVEREPEEISNPEDIATSSLEEVDGKTIRHFSHQHELMRLCINGEEEEGERICKACILPIDFESFFGCKECDFALHDTCANLPLLMEHALHRHLLTLEVTMINNKEGFFSCSKCGRESCGFMYRCCQEECEFKMDAKCASLTAPLYNGAHQHPLTLLDTIAKCKECRFYLDLKRATLPVLVKCKYDIHPLTLCFAEYATWSPLCCEICEVKIKYGSPDYQDLYGCTHCNTTLHVDCVIGKYPYLKPGYTIKVNGFEIKIASNGLSRPIFHACHCICQDKLVFKDKRDVVSFCSFNCITSQSYV